MLGDSDFWEGEYSDRDSQIHEPFDWFFDFADLDQTLWATLLGPTRSRIMVLGCGHSSMSADMVDRGGWANVTSVDSSETVIQLMRAKRPDLEWLVGDARDLTGLPDGAGADGRYDVVVDKGLLDALLSYRGDMTAGDSAAREAARLLKPGGISRGAGGVR